MAPAPWSLRWGLCVVSECTPEYNAQKVYAVYVYVHHSHTDRTYSHHRRQQSAIALQSILSRHQSSRAWWCRGVSVSLARGTRGLSHSSSRWFPMVLGDTAGATGAWISSLDAVRAATAAGTMRQSWHASVLRGRPEPGLRVWECPSDHCWKQRHTTDPFCPIRVAICLPARFQRFALFVLISLYHH